jgi:hypothetical protein
MNHQDSKRQRETTNNTHSSFFYCIYLNGPVNVAAQRLEVFYEALFLTSNQLYLVAD